MRHYTHRSVSGFTLTELAIVLAVVGVLVAGLWNLLSGANTQVRDNAAASQHAQLISSVKAFLASSDGQSYMTNNNIPAGSGGCNNANCPQGSNFALPLSASGNCTEFVDVHWQTFCSFLPPGFLSTANNAYGQTYAIRILRDASTLAGQAPVTYSFMIMTSGGDRITDTSGARISSLIGGDGGFIYSAVAAACGAAPFNNWACGSYSGWSALVTTYGFAVGTSGTIASRTYVSPEQQLNNQWLARLPISGDFSASRLFNSMTVPAYLGGNEMDMGIYSNATMATTAAGYQSPVGTGGWLNMQGGRINLGYDTVGGTVPAQTTTTGEINLQGGMITGTGKSNIALTGDATTTNAMLSVNNPATCTMTSPNVPATCPYAMQATTVNVINLLQATALYAGTFIYNSSDIRLKKDIHPINHTLKDIMQLNPVSFSFKSNNKEGLGFIAQDVEKIYPQLVVPGSGGMKAVNYEGLIAPLVASVQELKKENDQLRRQIEAQETKQEKLEREIRNRSDQ